MCWPFGRRAPSKRDEVDAMLGVRTRRRPTPLLQEVDDVLHRRRRRRR